MDKNTERLLDKIEMNKEYYPYFYDAKITKVKVYSETNTWDIFIDKNDLLPLDVFKELYDKLPLLDKSVKEISIIWNINNKDINMYLEYFNYLLITCKSKVKLIDNFLDKASINDDKLEIEYTTLIGENKLKKLIPILESKYKLLGYENGIISVKKEDNTKETIKKELEVKEEDIPKKKVVKTTSSDEDNILGRRIKEEPLTIKSIMGEDNNVIIEGEIFGIDLFESSKSDFKIITLKLTDGTDSIYCKVFAREKDEFKRLSKALKEGMNVKVRGYTKNDQYSRELVLNARDIEKIEKTEEERIDTSEIKRVELHTHTKMSQMDGIADEVELVKQAIKWNHKAIAITDHNSVQAFPHVFDFIKGYNKNKSDKDRFKVIYGLETTMIDDKINIITRETDSVLLDEEYVVFDFETTGFNAGGMDSIIEIGAVKIKDGMITDRYDELINPGRPLPPKIIELTQITDEMLQDKRTEEEAVRDFINWFGNLPMVAHNAKFDVSFLEMAYRKYDLGSFQNTVIDTLELSRALDTNYSRHSLSALAKRYNILKTDKNPDGFWDEESHHRGDYDAEGTALIFWKMLKKLSDRNIDKMTDIDRLIDSDEIYKFGRSHHVNI